MNKLTIAVDIDDVLARGTESLRLEVNKRLGVNLLPEHYAVPGEYWGYYEQVWRENGLEGRVSLDTFDSQMAADQSHVPPFEQAKDVISELQKKYRLLVVTARNVDAESATNRWLNAHFPNVFDGVHFAGREPRQTKGELCHALGVDWLIDDNVGHADSARAYGIRVLLFGDYGWHKKAEIHDDIIRCQDWRAVKEYFDGLG